MSTTASPAQGQPRGGTFKVLLISGSCVVAAMAAVTSVGAIAEGSHGALGALVGGSIALCFFVLGSLVVETAARLAPQTAMMVALLTYTLQVVLLAVVFARLMRSDALGTTLSVGWLAGGIAMATVAWTAGQLVGSTRARILAYDIDLPGAADDAPEPSSHRDRCVPHDR